MRARVSIVLLNMISLVALKASLLLSLGSQVRLKSPMISQGTEMVCTASSNSVRKAGLSS